LLTASGCGGDDTQNPNGNGGNGGGEVTVLSASTSDGWTCDFFISIRSGSSCSNLRTYDTDSIGSFWIPEGFRIYTRSTPGTDCCNAQLKSGSITSKKLDLSGYASLRLQGHLKLYFERQVTGLGQAWVGLTLLSNVPNTPDLEIAYEKLTPSQTGEFVLEKSIDVSLENAIGHKEATLFINGRVDGGCGGSYPTYVPAEVYVELRALRIVATK
jgi:hypothetical protein